MVAYKMCLVLKQRIRKHLLNASRQQCSSDDDEDTLGFVRDIDAVSNAEYVCIQLVTLLFTSQKQGRNDIGSVCLSAVRCFCQ